MKKRDQDCIIATYCGHVPSPTHPGLFLTILDGEHVTPHEYSSDLNAIHLAELSLSEIAPGPDTKSDRTRYRENLCVVSACRGGPIHAPANLRTEAFLKTIGKWIE